MSPRSAKTAYEGSRLKVWTWQHDDLARRLGTKPFDLLGWYPQLNAELETTGASYADPWQWLQQRFYADAKIPLPNLFGKKPQPAQVAPKVTTAAEQRAKWEREMAGEPDKEPA